MMVPGGHDAVLGEPSPIIGDVASAEQAAVFAGSVSEDCVSYLLGVESASRFLTGATGDSVRRIQVKLDTSLLTGAVKLADSADASKRSFASYASAVEGIRRRARAIQQAVDAHLAVIRAEASAIEGIAAQIRRPAPMSWENPPSPVMPEPALAPARVGGMDELEQDAARRALAAANEAQWQHAVLSWTAAVEGVRDERAHWRKLVAERTEAERTLVAALRDTVLGQLITVGSMPGGPGPKFAIAQAIAGELWGRAAAPAEAAKRHPALAGLLPGGDGSGIWAAAPEPTAVAAWWGALDDTTRERLIHEVPWVIGNLPGLPFGVRDRANRETLEFYGKNPTLLSSEQLTVAAEVQRILDREAGEEAESSDGRADPPVQLIALDLSHRVPKAAVGYGDSDAATHTSWAVPGMESDAHLALESWDAASRNLYAAQNDTDGFAGSSSVIAWLGYDTPDLVDSLNSDGVLAPDAARAGALRLAAELDGNRAARGAAPHAPPTVNVLAHSYGTTTATIALTLVRHPVDSLALVASAGIDPGTVPSYEALRVAEASPGQPAIYTTHAAEDYLAPTGAGLSGRGQPNPGAEGMLGLHALSPVYESALSFSSDGDPERGLLPADGHSIIGEGERRGPAGISSSAGHGYLDVEAQTLNSLAQITTGQIGDRLADSFVVTEKPSTDQYLRLIASPMSGGAT